MVGTSFAANWKLPSSLGGRLLEWTVPHPRLRPAPNTARRRGSVLQRARPAFARPPPLREEASACSGLKSLSRPRPAPTRGASSELKPTDGLAHGKEASIRSRVGHEGDELVELQR